MTTLRIDNSEWISNSLVIGNTGLGVLGSDIPSTGEDGPSFLYNDLDLPNDANKEIRALILTWPSDGDLFVYEDGSFSFTDAPDGTYFFTYDLYVDGVKVGDTATVTLNVGSTISANGVVTSTCTASLSTGIQFGADLFTVSLSSASLTTSINLAAAVVLSTTSSSDLSTSILLATQASVVASIVADLEDSPTVPLDASAFVVSTSTAALTTDILLSAFAQARATGTASLTVNSGGISPSDRLTIIFNMQNYKVTLD